MKTQTMYTLTKHTIEKYTGKILLPWQLEYIEKAMQTDKANEGKQLNGHITIEQIVCNILNVDAEKVFNPNERHRDRVLMNAAHMATYFYFEFFNVSPERPFTLSNKEIGQIINRDRDRATASHRRKTASNLIDSDKWFSLCAYRVRIAIGQHLTDKTLKVTRP